MLNNTQNDDEYVALVEPGSGYNGAESYYTIARIDEKKKKACSGCCCMSLIIFLLLWFLLPRGPQMVLQEVDLYYDATASSPVTMAEQFWFKNNNFYTMKWNGLTTKVKVCRNSLANAYLFGCLDSQNGQPVSDPILQTEYHTSGNSTTFTTGGRKSTTIRQDFHDAQNSNCDGPDNLCDFAFIARNCKNGIVFQTEAQVESELNNGHKFPTYHLTVPWFVQCV
mmetsp:Transcript_16115/g.33038  ORF Transcript_16115/g.33038 Transcript_16115/m.33038 type:complete len:224 (+) Transcript_16115:23-694(+)